MKKKFFCAFLLFGQSFLLLGQQKITFKTGVFDPLKDTSQRLFLAGDFNGWNPGNKDWEMLPDGHGAYALIKNLPKGLYHFKVTRSDWKTVECTKDGKPTDNRTVSIANDTTIVMNIE